MQAVALHYIPIREIPDCPFKKSNLDKALPVAVSMSVTILVAVSLPNRYGSANGVRWLNEHIAKRERSGLVLAVEQVV